MATSIRAPKQWCLTKTENITSFESWRQNLVYTLSLDKNFAPFLVAGVQWRKRTRDNPHRGLVNDPQTVPEESRRTREQKVTILELLLGQIANFCPVVSRNTIVKNSTSLDNIWQSIRLHYGFQSTGAHFIDFAAIKFQADERPEDLYQRIIAFIEDNLLKPDSGITHNGSPVTEKEELSPSLENYAVLTWLRLIHEGLPKLVKQRYGPELRSKTLASIKPEISQALDSLLEELQACEDAKVMRATANDFRNRSDLTQSRARPPQNRRPTPKCPLCKEAGRPYSHYLSKCLHLPPEDRKFLARARRITDICEQSDSDEPDETLDRQPVNTSVSASVNRVQVQQSPCLYAFHECDTVCITIDSGATGNMMKASYARFLGVNVSTTKQLAKQADGLSPLKVVGEVHTSFTCDGHVLTFEGLVVENLDSDILAGMPFMEVNDIAIRPAKHEIHIGDTFTYKYGSLPKADTHSVKRAQVLRAPSTGATIWPGEFLEVALPDSLAGSSETYAIEPRSDLAAQPDWPEPTLVTSVQGKVRLANTTDHPLVLKRNEHFCQVRQTSVSENVDQPPFKATIPEAPLTYPKYYSDLVKVDPDGQLDTESRTEFRKITREFDDVFSPSFKGYNGAFGPFKGEVNMGPVLPPQRKGRLPQYSRSQLEELQRQFDELEEIGVFQRPEDVGVNVEYLNPSFLVKKPNGGFRLVTAFADVGRYAKPQPSLLPDVDNTLRQIAQWKHIITTDLTKAFYQIPLSKASMKYCGTVTPFRGVRVYTRCAMGMPGSETALEELMCRALGDLLVKGTVVKLADDLYCGGNSPEELLANWRDLLAALRKCGLNLSAAKTVIAPKEVTILGWLWSCGSIRASPHRVSTLSSCSRPTTVTGLRSFIGAYRVLSRVLRDTASHVAPLEEAIAGKTSREPLNWTENLAGSFTKAQASLTEHKVIHLPRIDDQLCIVTDGSMKMHGLGATLYLGRNNKILLGGFFSAKLRNRQMTWLPCEIEALSIASAIKHFAPYIIQSKHDACILTDSKPCVQAYEKLRRGEFSASPRVLTFLSTASRFSVSIRHVKGSAILPSDHASRNAPECFDPTCQICVFVHQCEDSSVRNVSIDDISKGSSPLPYISRAAWLQIQSECSDLRRTHAHLKQGTRPSRKVTNAKDVKRYIQVATVAADGLLVVRQHEPFASSRDRIIVPRDVVHGLLTSLHLKLDHPSSHQLKVACRRYFYALDMDKAIDTTTHACHTCSSLRKCPTFVAPQSTSDPPESVGTAYAADVIRRERQMIFVLRECVTSYTMATIIEDERKESLRSALLRLCIEFLPMDGPFAVVRTDPAPGFVSLVNDSLLSRHRIAIEVGRAKNVNKNPVAEKAVQEVEDEILRVDPGCRMVTPLALALAIRTVNSRIRTRGLSAREMWTQRDQFNNDQLPVDDREMILQQHSNRLQNHKHSEVSKAPKAVTAPSSGIAVGDLVYLYVDRNKSAARSRYLVTSIEGNWCNIRKFVGSQLRKMSYRVRLTDCFVVPSSLTPNVLQAEDLSEDESPIDISDTAVERSLDAPDSSTDRSVPPILPDIPSVISDPPFEPIVSDSEDSTSRAEDQESLPLRRSTRERRKPSHLADFVLS